MVVSNRTHPVVLKAVIVNRVYLYKCQPAASHDTPGPLFLCQNAERQLQFALSHNVVGKTTLYDMEVDHSQRHILTACQDRNIRVYNVSNGKHSKTFKGSIADDGTLIKVGGDS